MDDKSRAIDHTGERIGSLDVLRKDGVIEQQYRYLHNHRHYDAFTVYDKYLCKCYLCGKEYNIRGDKLSINPPSDYGYNAYNGYYCEAKCDCHPQSSLQWKINKGIKHLARLFYFPIIIHTGFACWKNMMKGIYAGLTPIK